jgi:hypothetical protein
LPILCRPYHQKRTFGSAKQMSALGQKQTFAPQKAMSALPPNSDRKSGFPHKVMSALPPESGHVRCS